MKRQVPIRWKSLGPARPDRVANPISNVRARPGIGLKYATGLGTVIVRRAPDSSPREPKLETCRRCRRPNVAVNTRSRKLAHHNMPGTTLPCTERNRLLAAPQIPQQRNRASVPRQRKRGSGPKQPADAPPPRIRARAEIEGRYQHPDDPLKPLQPALPTTASEPTSPALPPEPDRPAAQVVSPDSLPVQDWAGTSPNYLFDPFRA